MLNRGTCFRLSGGITRLCQRFMQLRVQMEGWDRQLSISKVRELVEIQDAWFQWEAENGVPAEFAQEQVVLALNTIRFRAKWVHRSRSIEIWERAWVASQPMPKNRRDLGEGGQGEDGWDRLVHSSSSPWLRIGRVTSLFDEGHVIEARCSGWMTSDECWVSAWVESWFVHELFRWLDRDWDEWKQAWSKQDVRLETVQSIVEIVLVDG